VPVTRIAFVGLLAFCRDLGRLGPERSKTNKDQMLMLGPLAADSVRAHRQIP
jgi:hypothetical protein